jgi:hypothetical protein
MERLSLSLQLDTENNMSVDSQQHNMNEQQVMEESHHHHTAHEFSDMILSLGPNAVLSLLSDEARSELRKSIIIQYNHRLVETSGL